MLVAAALTGCTSTVQNLKQHGVEVKSGKVMRVYRF